MKTMTDQFIKNVFKSPSSYGVKRTTSLSLAQKWQFNETLKRFETIFLGPNNQYWVAKGRTAGALKAGGLERLVF